MFRANRPIVVAEEQVSGPSRVWQAPRGPNVRCSDRIGPIRVARPPPWPRERGNQAEMLGPSNAQLDCLASSANVAVGQVFATIERDSLQRIGAVPATGHLDAPGGIVCGLVAHLHAPGGIARGLSSGVEAG